MSRTCIHCGVKGCKKTIKSGLPIIGRRSHPALSWSCIDSRQCRRRVAMKKEVLKPDVVRKQSERQAAIEVIRRRCKRRADEIEQKRLDEFRRKEIALSEIIPRYILKFAPDWKLMLKHLEYSKYTGYRNIEEQKTILMKALELFEEQEHLTSENARLGGIAFVTLWRIINK